ncbi:MAG: hypothetical protein ACYDCN_04390 [Bacteroidia bacterium]
MLIFAEDEVSKMITEKLNIYILAFLGVGLFVTALIKNYHYVKFSSILEKEKINVLTLIFRILGDRVVGLVWIFPFRIKESSINKESQKHKDSFNKVSKYFRYFWAAIVLYCLVFMMIMDR